LLIEDARPRSGSRVSSGRERERGIRGDAAGCSNAGEAIPRDRRLSSRARSAL